MTTLLDRILELMDNQGISAVAMTTELGISKTSFTDWKKGKGKPSLDTVVKFSDYFNVSLDYLVRGEEYHHSNTLEYSNPRDEQFLLKLHSLPPEMQDQILSYTDGMLAASSAVSVRKKLSV